MKKYLLTGASGLIGRHLIPKLLAEAEIFSLVRHKDRECPEGVYQIPMDLSLPLQEDRLPKKIDGVIHLAQSENFRRFPEKAIDIFAVNTNATLYLLDYARRAGAHAFILASSGAVYPEASSPCHEEDGISLSSLAPNFYRMSKLAAEMAAAQYISWMNVMTLRFFFVYGPGQREGMLIPRLTASVLNGQPVQLQGDAGIRINPIYCTDAAEAVKKSLLHGQSAHFNVGGSELLSIKTIAETVGEVLDRSPLFHHTSGGAPIDLWADIQKMEEALVKPQVTFREGIRCYVDSLLKVFPTGV